MRRNKIVKSPDHIFGFILGTSWHTVSNHSFKDERSLGLKTRKHVLAFKLATMTSKFLCVNLLSECLKFK